MLYHFSEEPGIKRFEPRVMIERPGEPARVWAISEERSPNYLFPRDCPRICICPAKHTTPEDLERFFGLGASRHIIAVESTWISKIRGTTLYRYAFLPDAFAVEDQCAGYYTSMQAVVPESVEPVGDLLAALTAAGVDLFVLQSLGPLKEAVLKSTVDYSMIRLRNARL